MIPNKVKIGGYMYDIEQTDKPIILNARECHGQIDYDHHKILLSTTTQCTQGMNQTFWHEVIHGFANDRGIDWGENDEEYTDNLAKALHAFCVDNGLEFPKGDPDANR